MKSCGLGVSCALLTLVACLFSAPPVAACTECTPARPVVQELWGELEPLDPDPLPDMRDSTSWGSNQLSTKDIPLWVDLVFAGVENPDGARRYLFTAFVGGMEIWSLEDPKNPVRLSALDGWDEDFFRWPGGGHTTEVIKVIGAAPENDDLVAVGGQSFGFAVIDATNKEKPKTIYQHSGYTVNSLYVKKLGERIYAFSANEFQGPVAYDLTAAKSLVDSTGKTCLELVDEGGQQCPGVYLGPVGPGASFRVDGSGTYVANARFLDLGVDLFDVADPANPRHLVRDLQEIVYGVALWETNGQYYLAVRLQAEGRIYNVTSCLTSSCNGFAQNLLWSKDLIFVSNDQRATFSRSNGTPVVHFGNWPGTGVQADFLFDVSDPSKPREILPRKADGSPKTITVDGKTVNYLSWYYSTNPTGLSSFAPLMAKFTGPYLFRASRSVLDIHRWNGPSGPTISVDGPSEGWQGDLLDFAASPNTACPAVAGGWTWDTAGAQIEAGQGSAEVTLRWPIGGTPGFKTVKATNSGCPDATVNGHVIDIQNPEPAVGTVTATPSTAPQCTPISIQAENVSGRGTPSFSWAVDTVPVTSGSGNPFLFVTDPTAGNVPELISETSYQATVTVTNPTCPAGSGCEAQGSTTVTLQPLEPLPANGEFTPTRDPFTAATVRFHADDLSDGVDLGGATEWAWDFDGNDVFTPFTNDPADPVGGANPVHTYTEQEILDACPSSTVSSGVVTPPCEIPVRVKITNCLDDTLDGRISGELVVTIEELTPLHAEFAAKATCAVAPCSPEFKVDEAITFEDKSTGAELYDYDWDGKAATGVDGFEDSGHTSPVTTHAYTDDGSYQPRLQVRRGADESDVYVHPSITVKPAEPVEPPSISVSGPSSGLVGQTLTFRAGWLNCDAAANGWSWTVTGLSVSDNDSSITVSFPSTGRKTVTASNSACGTAQGSTTVSINEEDDGGGGDPAEFEADFTVDPAAPAVGDLVTFDASSSTGNPTSFTWTFPGGVTKKGDLATFTFQGSGPATVELKIEKVDPSVCTGIRGLCTDSASKTLTVAPGNDVVATFETTAECVAVGRGTCTAKTGQDVVFTANQGDADRYIWEFDDGPPIENGKQVTHHWMMPKSYTVTLTVEKDGKTASESLTIKVEGDPIAQVHRLVIPFVAHSGPETVLPQESDLFVHNPGSSPITVAMTFHKQGKAEAVEADEPLTVGPRETRRFRDVLTEVFARPNLKGFVELETEDTVQPVAVSFHRTFKEDRVYGQVIPGEELESLETARKAAGESLHLVGLHDTASRQGTFGITNPYDAPVGYALTFFDSLGQVVENPSEEQRVSRLGLKNYQIETLRTLGGITGLEDYRVEIRAISDSPRPLVFGKNLRLSSTDPSFVRPGKTGESEVFLIGVLDTQGNNDSVFESDVVLANTSDRETLVDLQFFGVGFQTEPSDPLPTKTLGAGQTLRLENIVEEWSPEGGIGAIRVVSDNPLGTYPVVQGESYETARPDEIFGQFMPALTLEDVASPARPRTLIGLRQDADFATASRSTLWLYNPGDEVADFTLRYFDHDGNELGEISGRLGVGKFRQINPSHHPMAAEGAPDGFVVRLEVSSGEVLFAGQVVNEFNDPAYLVGR